jgi:predicted exporter
MTDPATYDIRVEGHLDDHWSDRLGGLALTRNVDGTTTLTGRLADQAQLYGVLAGLRDIGATLLSLEVGGRRPRIHGAIDRQGEDHDPAE